MQNSVYQVWIGVDVAARKLDLYDLQREHHQVIENDLLAISSFISQLSRLRKKLGPDVIETERGLGYRLGTP